MLTSPRCQSKVKEVRLRGAVKLKSPRAPCSLVSVRMKPWWRPQEGGGVSKWVPRQIWATHWHQSLKQWPYRSRPTQAPRNLPHKALSCSFGFHCFSEWLDYSLQQNSWLGFKTGNLLKHPLGKAQAGPIKQTHCWELMVNLFLPDEAPALLPSGQLLKTNKRHCG